MTARARAVVTDPDLGAVPDRVLAARHGLTRAWVTALRHRAGVEGITHQGHRGRRLSASHACTSPGVRRRARR